MIQINHTYVNKEGLQKAISDTGIDPNSGALLVQMFSSVREKSVLESTAAAVMELLPNGVLLGATTAGEIIDGSMLDEQTVLSITLFEKSRIRSAHAIGTDSEQVGIKLGSTLAGEDVRCVICFADGLRHSSGFLEGLQKYFSDDVLIAGGMAGDLFRFECTYVIHQGEVFEGGAGLYLRSACPAHWESVRRAAPRRGSFPRRCAA